MFKDDKHEKYRKDNNLNLIRSSSLLNKDELYEIYFIKKMSIIECAKHFKTHTRTIKNNFKYFGWKWRSKSEASILNNAEHAERFRQLGYKNRGKKYSEEECIKRGVKGHFSVLKGQTKETHEGIRRAAEKLALRNKNNCERLRLYSEKMKTMTKDNSDQRRRQAESHYVHSTDACRNYMRQYILENKNQLCKEIVIWKTYRQGFRWFDVLRSMAYLCSTNDEVIRYLCQNSSAESKIENEVLIPFLENNFYKCNIKRQLRIIKGNGIRGQLDILVLKENTPFLVVESKSSLPKKTISKCYFDQLHKYSRLINTKYYLLSDGNKFHWYSFDFDEDVFSEISNIQNVPEIIEREYNNAVCCK
jgi:hypothetical protein